MNAKSRELVIKSFFVIIIIVIINFFWQKNYESLEKRYVIGEVKRIVPALRQDPKVEFSFIIYGNSYIQNTPRSVHKPKSGEIYIVEVPIKDIKKSRILLDHPVQDSMKSPWEGWEEIPELLRKE